MPQLLFYAFGQAMQRSDFKSSSELASLIEAFDVPDPDLISRNKIFVASSRLTRKLDTIPMFFESLLTLATKLDPEKDVLVTATGTTCDRFVCRIGQLFAVPVLHLQVATTTAKFDTLVAESGPNQVVLLAKPKVGVDQLLATLADQMVVLSLRAKGNLEQAVRSRLEWGKATRLLVAPSLTQRALSDELLGAGVRGWYLFSDTATEVETANVPSPTVFPEAKDSSEFLLHWTRRRSGPWPDQGLDPYLDDLIFGCPGKERSETTVLKRILATGRILASNDLTRDPRPVVCFSDVRFGQLQQRRVFRPHLSRWDFEPFGIALSKSWLKQQGARAVVYGDDQCWAGLTDEQRPFYQAQNENAKVDWSQEAEWRLVGDLDLRKVPTEMGMVFVPTAEHANQVAAFSRWPVVVLRAPE